MGIRAMKFVKEKRRAGGFAQAVLAYLADCMNDKTGRCDPMRETIAEYFSAEDDPCTVKRVERALARLRTLGFIETKRVPYTRPTATGQEGGWHNVYVLVGFVPGDANAVGVTNISDVTPKTDVTPNMDRGHPQNVQWVTLTVDRGHPQNGGIKHIEQEENKKERTSMCTSGNATYVVASAQAQTPYPEDFDKSLFEEAEREAHGFPDPIPEPPALPPVEPPSAPASKPKMAYPPCQYEKVVELYHSNCRGLRRVMAITDVRKRTINARWREFCKEDNLQTTAEVLDSFDWFFQEVAKSRFLMGFTQPGPGRDLPFKADFDWLMRPNNFLKVCEGKYTNGPQK